MRHGFATMPIKSERQQSIHQHAALYKDELMTNNSVLEQLVLSVDGEQ